MIRLSGYKILATWKKAESCERQRTSSIGTSAIALAIPVAASQPIGSAPGNLSRQTRNLAFA